MSRVLRIGGAQMGPIHKADSRQAVVRRMLDLLDQARARTCDLVVYPELALTTFFPRWYMTDQSEVDAWFEREMPNAATRPLFEQGCRIPHRTVVRLCRAHRRRPSLQHIHPGRSRRKNRRASYRKVHLPGHSEFDPQRAFQHLEKRYFEPGDLGFPVWRTMGGILGMCICNDRRWPETYRVLGLQGVELIVLGYNTPSVNSQKADEGPQKRLFHHRLTLQAGAYQNSTWVVAVAKSGAEDGYPDDCRQRHRQSGRRDRRRGRDRGRRADRGRLRSRRHHFRQGDDLRLQAPPPDRALRPHHQSDRRHPAAARHDHGRAVSGGFHGAAGAGPLQAPVRAGCAAADCAGHHARSRRHRQRGTVLVLQCVRGVPAADRSRIADAARWFAEGYVRTYSRHRLVHRQPCR